MLEQKWYTVAEVAKMTGLTDRTIRNYLKDGTMHGKKIGVQWRFTEEDINALFQDVDFSQKLAKPEHNLIETFLLEEKEKAAECHILDFPEVSRDKWDILLQKIRKNMKNTKSSELRFAWEYTEERNLLRIVVAGEPEMVRKMTNEIKKGLKTDAE